MNNNYITWMLFGHISCDNNDIYTDNKFVIQSCVFCLVTLSWDEFAGYFGALLNTVPWNKHMQGAQCTLFIIRILSGNCSLIYFHIIFKHWHITNEISLYTYCGSIEVSKICANYVQYIKTAVKYFSFVCITV